MNKHKTLDTKAMKVHNWDGAMVVYLEDAKEAVVLARQDARLELIEELQSLYGNDNTITKEDWDAWRKKLLQGGKETWVNCK